MGIADRLTQDEIDEIKRKMDELERRSQETDRRVERVKADLARLAQRIRESA